MAQLYYHILYLLLLVSIPAGINAQNLLINEVVSSNFNSLLDTDGENYDWIELYNAGNSPIYLGDYYLTDDQSKPLKWRLPNQYLSSHDFLVVYAAGHILPDGIHANFKLSVNGETLILYDQNEIPLDQLVLPALKTDVSYGRTTDGAQDWSFFEETTPDSSNNASSGFTCLLQPPTIDQPSGSFPGSININVSHPDPTVEIRYSKTGNSPNTNSALVSSPVYISDPQDTINYSGIPTNPAFDFPQPGYTESRANNRGWVPPYSDQNRISIITAKAFKNGCISSKEVARSYLIQEEHDLHVLSIQTDSIGFFSDEEGIYVFGNDAEGNYSRTGIGSERSAQIDYFDKKGDLIFSNEVGLRIGGNGSRHSAQKNINVFFRGAYDSAFVTEKLFETSELKKWKRLSLRSGGHRPDCLPKDEFAAALLSNIDLDYAKFKYASTYLNGEYWGIHAIKERLNKHYLAEKYGFHKDSVTILSKSGDIEDGQKQDSIDYAEMIEFAKNNNLNDPANFNSILEEIDIDNYTDYLITEIFLGNADWPNSNIEFWKKESGIPGPVNRGHDGKWRWLVFDLDGSFGGTCNDVFVTFNTLEWALRDDASFDKYTVLFRNLIENDQYKTDFINRTCDLLNSSYKSNITRIKLNHIKNTLDLDIYNHISRWRYPSTSSTLADRYNEIPNTLQWEYLTHQMDTFLMERPHYVRKHMFNEWDLSDSIRLQVNVNDQTMGNVQVNSIRINSALEGVSQPVYPWTGIYFSDLSIPLIAEPLEGYRFVKWLETGNIDDTIYVTLNSDSLFTAIFEEDPNYSPLDPVVINEVQSSNVSTYFDIYNQYDDWIEIYNPNETSVNLRGYYLSDNSTDLEKYKIDNDLIIQAKDHLVIWCDAQNEQGLDHTNFKLSDQGEFIALSSPTLEIVDSITFSSITTNYSFGRSSDGATEWVYFISPTPDAPNEVKEIEEKSIELIVYPNPNRSSILYANIPIQGAIYSSTGALILTFDKTQQIDLPNLSQGIYYLITDEGVTRKILLL